MLPVCNTSEYLGYLPEGKGSRCVELAALPLPHAECLEILGASISWSPKSLSRPM